MNGWLYLIRNRDLYKIGITKNFENRMRSLKPDTIVAKLYTSDFLKLEKELHNRYKKYRIPQTEYFRLEHHHIKEIRQRISQIDNSMSSVFFKSLSIIILFLCIILIILSLIINDNNIILAMSLLWMERISFGYAFFSLFVYSGKYFSFWNELKYRFTRLIIFILFSFLFRLATIFFD